MIPITRVEVLAPLKFSIPDWDSSGATAFKVVAPLWRYSTSLLVKMFPEPRAPQPPPVLLATRPGEIINKLAPIAEILLTIC